MPSTFAFEIAASISSWPWPTSTVIANSSSTWYFSFARTAHRDESNPPEYASATFFAVFTGVASIFSSNLLFNASMAQPPARLWSHKYTETCMITQPLMIGILCSRVRVEEKALFETLRRRGIPFDRPEEDRIKFTIGGPFPHPGVVLDRSIHHGRSLYALTLLNAAGVPTVNRARVARICGDQILTPAAPARAR